MTKEEAKEILISTLRDINSNDNSFEYTTEQFTEAMLIAIESLSNLPLPSNLDEAARKYGHEEPILPEGYNDGDIPLYERRTADAFKSGAEWMAGQGWIDDGSMPPETKQESDTPQGRREWTESELVLAWDSMYGCRVDWTRNGKWMSEQTGGYTGQICHGIIAWRPIPEYKEKQ